MTPTWYSYTVYMEKTLCDIAYFDIANKVQYEKSFWNHNMEHWNHNALFLDHAMPNSS